MRTLVPKCPWSCLSQPIPGSTRAEHKAMLGLALEERVRHLDKAVHQAHDWLSSNPFPWDAILWAHPPTLSTPSWFCMVRSVPPSTCPLGPAPHTSTPRLSPNMPYKNRPIQRQPKHNQPVARLKTPTAHQAAHPHHAPPPSAIPRPLQRSRPRQPQKRHRSSQTHHTTIVWWPPKRAKTTSPLHPNAPRHATVKHAYLSPLGPPLLGAEVRLPLPPPPLQRLPGHPKFLPPVQRLSVPSSRLLQPSAPS